MTAPDAEAPHREDGGALQGRRVRGLQASYTRRPTNRRFEYRVRYRRIGTRDASRYRYYQTSRAARRMAARLTRDDGQYAAIIDITIQRRPVGDWDTYEVVI